MDTAVSLVQTYLRLNGYFTVTEFPVVELARGADYRTATDLDILAFRFPSARRIVPGEEHRRHPRTPFELDPALEAPAEGVDMIVGEVKESVAEFNPPGRRPEVLAAALARFGCCSDDASRGVVEELLARGRARTGLGHDVRLVAFGGRVEGTAPYLRVSLGQVLEFLRRYVRDHWDVLKHIQAKDPVLAWLLILEKLRAGDRATA